ncbi:tripartite tricarboxylate transporter substrate binding protein [Ramlibacter terrae]|uniref:Tripartite tricarboxylate transporter substrate binding protein n=1 Tax=Ramlibacter terrae TaxID=2732511 RepID=A0ABX6P6T1_9BURK|nr:tripartite tricarboxylate transporter substrate binding protein [Ramlibacter terrae]
MRLLPILAALALVVPIVAGPAPAQAQQQPADAYPSRPVRLVIPYPPGGSTDQLARALQQPLADFLKQPVVVENKAGAGGAIGTDMVAKAPPDGYTILFANSGPNAILPLLRKTPYDTARDLRSISTVAFMPMILAVPADSAAKDLRSFLELAKANGAVELRVRGKRLHVPFGGEYYLNMVSGLKLAHVPYGGAAPMMTALAGGQLEAAFVTGMDGTPMVQGGRIRYPGIGTPKRSSILPTVPAIGEQVPGFSTVVWFGIMAPAGVPEHVAARLHAAVVHAVGRPEVQRMFIDRNVEPRTSTPEELDRLIREESVQWKEVITRGGIKLD